MIIFCVNYSWKMFDFHVRISTEFFRNKFHLFYQSVYLPQKDAEKKKTDKKKNSRRERNRTLSFLSIRCQEQLFPSHQTTQPCLIHLFWYSLVINYAVQESNWVTFMRCLKYFLISSLSKIKTLKSSSSFQPFLKPIKIQFWGT